MNRYTYTEPNVKSVLLTTRSRRTPTCARARSRLAPELGVDARRFSPELGVDARRLTRELGVDARRFARELVDQFLERHDEPLGVALDDGADLVATEPDKAVLWKKSHPKNTTND